MVAVRKPVDGSMTVEAFLAWPGDGTGRRHQLIHGEPEAMSPASPTHGLIQAALARLLENHFIAGESPCRTATEPPVVPRLGADTNLRVPDLAVTCRPEAPDGKLFPDPALIVEILSPGNERETRDGMWAYASIPSLRAMLLVHSTRVGAELYERMAGGPWPERPQIIDPNGELVLACVGFRCALADLYARTHLAGPDRAGPDRAGPGR